VKKPKVIRRQATQATGASVGPGKAKSKTEITLPGDGSLTIRKAENGVVLSIWDSSKKYDDPDHEKTYVVDNIQDVVLK